MLLEECRASEVKVFTGTAVAEVQRTTHFVVSSDLGEFHSDSLVVATGGLSIPKIGATAFGYDLARQFGINVRECRPALVPLIWRPGDLHHYGQLAGVSTEVIASAGGTRFREKMLLTHRGLSGPAILQISSYWQGDESVLIDLAPGREVFASLRRHTSSRDLSLATTALRNVLPARFAERWLSLHAPARWTNAALDDLEHRLHRWEVHPAGTEGFEKAEVTAGGVDTDELSAKTMEARKVPGLFFIGEIVDVTGHLGGFNFQWAWASGFAAGQAV
jgi:predicted Rossmann fold flavoprotein